MYTNKTLEPIDGTDYIERETTNRGNKLKVGSSFIHRDQLNGYATAPRVSIVAVDGEEREFIERKRKTEDVINKPTKKICSKDDNKEENDEEEEAEEEAEENDYVLEDPYKDIDIQKILAPITRPPDLVAHPAISKIFQDDSLRNLASQAIDMIEYEQNNSNALSSLMELFLGEDPKFLKVKNMQLPDYDHELVDGETVEEMKYKLPRHKNDMVIESTTDNGSTNNMKPEDYMNALHNNENKRITRNIDNTYQEVDPFFALPQFEIDPNNGVNPHIANEIRQITQITLQRNQEYIRSLQRIRVGLTRAERLKDQVYKWCREMNGDYDSELSAPPAAEKKK